jgi:Flp pilus assembly pilin Flp
MNKSVAIRLIPGSSVMFRGRRHSVVSATRGSQSDAPFFRLRDLDDAWVVSYKLLELMPEESVTKTHDGLEPVLKNYQGWRPEKVESATKMFIRVRESVVRNTNGQTMTEYALILAAIAVVAWGAYNHMGHDIGSMASGIDSDLTSS